MAALGWFGYLRAAVPEARCDGAPMVPGDICRTSSDGGRLHRTFEEALASSADGLTWSRMVAIAIAGLAPVVLAVVLWRTHQDRRLLARLRHDRGTPISMHSATADAPVGALAMLFGMFAGAALVFNPSVLRREGPLFFVLVLVAVVLAVVLIPVAMPRRGLLVQIFDTGIRLIANGRVHDLPWADVHLEVDVPETTPLYFLSARGLDHPLPLPRSMSDFARLEHALMLHGAPEPITPPRRRTGPR